jgi:hypothetical protein
MRYELHRKNERVLPYLSSSNPYTRKDTNGEAIRSLDVVGRPADIIYCSHNSHIQSLKPGLCYSLELGTAVSESVPSNILGQNVPVHSHVE